MRRNHAEVFHQLYPEALLTTFEYGLQSVLKERDQHGRQIFLFETGKLNNSHFNSCSMFSDKILVV